MRQKFLPTAVVIIVIWVKFTHTKNIDVFSAISYLTTSNLLWFMDLSFQVPVQYCSLQHRTLFPSPVTPTTGCYFCYGSISSFFLEIFLHWSPVSMLSSYWPGEFIFQCPIFSPFHTVLGVLKARMLKWFATPFSMDHILSDLSTMTRPSWAALHGMAHHLIELARLWSMCSVWLVFCSCGFYSVCPLTDEDKSLVEASWQEGLAVRKPSLTLVGMAMLRKSLLQFSADGWVCIPSL